MNYELPLKIKEIARHNTGLAFNCNFIFGDDDLFPNDRDIAMTDGFNIIISRKILKLPIENQIAVIAHEIAHLILMQCNIDHTENDADDYGSFLINKKIWYDKFDIQTIKNTFKTRPNYLEQ